MIFHVNSLTNVIMKFVIYCELTDLPNDVDSDNL